MANNNETSIIVRAVDKTEAALKTIEGNVGAVGDSVSRLTTIAGGFAAVAGVGLFAGMVKGSIESMAGLQDLSEQTGATVEGLSAIRSVAKLTGTDMESVGGALQKLSKNLVTLDDDGNAAAKAVAAIGLDAKKLKDMRPDEAMKSIADAMAEYRDGSEKTAIAQALFGKSGANLLPMFNDLAESGKLNAKVTAEQAKMADDLEKNFTKLSRTGQGWQNELTAGMLPALTSFTEAALETVNGVGGLREEFKKLSEDGTINEWATATLDGLTRVMDAGDGAFRVFAALGKTTAALLYGKNEDWKAEVGKIFEGPLVGQRLRESFAKTTEAKKQALTDYGQSVATVMAAYANADIKIQQAAQAALRNAYFGEEKKQLPYSPSADVSTAAKRDELKALLDKINGKESGLDASYWKDLETLNKAYQAGRLILEDYAAAVGKLTNDQKFAKDIIAKEAEAEKQLGQAWAHNAEIFWELVKARSDAEKFAIDTIDKLDLEATTLGMTSEARERYIALKQLDLQNTQGLIESEEEYLQRLNDINAAFNRRDTVKISVDAARRAADEWKKTSEIIEQSLTDALMRGFESGKGFGENFKDTLENLFKTMILRPVIQGVVQGGMSAMGMGGAQDAGGAGNLLSTGSSAYNMFSGGGMAGGFMSGMASAGSEAALGAAFVGPSATLAGGSIGVGAEVGSIFGAGASGIAAALPWVGGALAVASLLGAFDSSGPVGRSSKYDRSFGSVTDLGIAGSEAAGTAHNYKNNFRFSGDEMQASMDAFSATGAASEQNAIKALALTAEQIAAINAELQKSADIVYGFGTEHTDWTQSQADEQITAVRLQAMATALGKSVAEIAAAMDPAFGALVAAGRQIGLTADELAKLAPTSAAMQSLSANISAYRATYYTEAERQAEATSAIAAEFAKLGEAMPASKQGMRDLLEGLGKTTEEERKTYLGALALSGAFAQVADAQEAATAATRKALLDDSMTSVNTAYSALERAVAEQRASIEQAYSAQSKTWQDSVSASGRVRDNLGALVGTLASAVNTIRVESDALTMSRRDSAQATLDAALAAAQSGQSLDPFADQITGAIADLSKPSEDIYASFSDYAYAQGRANGVLSQLKDNAFSQKSVADMTLDAINGAALAAEQAYSAELSQLDRQLLDSKTQIDILNGIHTGILTIPEALAELAASMSGLTLERSLQGLNTGNGTSAAAVNAAGVNAAYQKYLGTNADPAGLDWQLSHIADGSNSLSQIVDNIANSEAAKAKAINVAYVQYLGTNADAAGLDWQLSHIADGSNSLSQIIENIRQAGAIDGSHASGLARVPFDGYIAELHRDERVLTADENENYSRVSALWRSPASGNNTARLEALVETLIAKVALLEKPLQNIDDQTSNQLTLLDRVTEGGNGMRSEIMNTVTVAA